MNFVESDLGKEKASLGKGSWALSFSISGILVSGPTEDLFYRVVNRKSSYSFEDSFLWKIFGHIAAILATHLVKFSKFTSAQQFKVSEL